LFNIQADWWFQEMGTISPNQHDFLFVVVHELIHGLGFTSSWNDYMNNIPIALTPNPLPPGQTDAAGTFSFTGFYENAFDRYLVEVPSMNALTAITRQLNAFDGGTATTNASTVGLRDMLEMQANTTASITRNFTSQDEFIQRFTASSAFNLSKSVLQSAIHPSSMAFRPDGADTLYDLVLLETGLKPFTMGSSIMHVDYRTFTNSSDFLMRFLQDPGVTLVESVHMSGNYVGGAVGPDLSRILATLGYPVNKNPVRLEDIFGANTANMREQNLWIVGASCAVVSLISFF